MERSRSVTVLSITALLLAIVATLIAIPADAQRQDGYLLFNTTLLGKNVREAVPLFEGGQNNVLPPESAQLDIKRGHYVAATIRYPKTLRFAVARQVLNRHYAKYEVATFAKHPNVGLWRNTDEQYSIQLSENDDYLEVIYIAFGGGR